MSATCAHVVHASSLGIRIRKKLRVSARHKKRMALNFCSAGHMTKAWPTTEHNHRVRTTQNRMSLNFRSAGHMTKTWPTTEHNHRAKQWRGNSHTAAKQQKPRRRQVAAQCYSDRPPGHSGPAPRRLSASFTAGSTPTRPLHDSLRLRRTSAAQGQAFGHASSSCHSCRPCQPPGTTRRPLWTPCARPPSARARASGLPPVPYMSYICSIMLLRGR